MSPKYRGDSEDWLDADEASHGRGRKRSALKAKKLGEKSGTELPLSDSNAVVVEVFPNQCRVLTDKEGCELLCSYRRASIFGIEKKDVRSRTPVAVGDRVVVARFGESENTGIIEGICIRRNSIYRLAPGGENRFHRLASNIDLVAIVASANQPAFSPWLIDRFLIGAQVEGIDCLICINKSDLMTSDHAWSVYRDLGYLVYEVSTRTLTGIDQLKEQCLDKAVVFCGHSGVGKTSLMRALTGRQIGRVGEVNEATGKGRHTTTGAILIQGPEHSKWIDTPGIREFGLMNVRPQDIAQAFPEFRNLKCKAPSCLHLDEPGCLAQSSLRYPNYRRILKSLLEKESN